MNRRGFLAVLVGAPIAAHLKPQAVVGVDWATGSDFTAFLSHITPLRGSHGPKFVVVSRQWHRTMHDWVHPGKPYVPPAIDASEMPSWIGRD